MKAVILPRPIMADMDRARFTVVAFVCNSRLHSP